MFAKIFETEEHGQILVKIDTNRDDLPEVRFYFEPEGLGVCSIAIPSKDRSEEVCRATEAFFRTVDEDHASHMVQIMKKRIGALVHFKGRNFTSERR